MMPEPLPPESGRAAVRARWARAGAGAVAGAAAVFAAVGLQGGARTPEAWAGLGLTVLLAIASSAFPAASRRSRLCFELALAAAGAAILSCLAPARGEALAVVVSARLLAGGLWLTARLVAREPSPSASEQLRVLGLFLAAGLTLQAYLTPQLVGPKDARWYGNAVIDFLTQVRGGKFPVFSGETIYAFNGNIQMVRSAPAHLYLAALIDACTFRSLAPLAVQHLALVGSYLAGILLVYVALARLRPGAAWMAWLLALVYATSPSLLTILVRHDMYMTFTAMPVLVFVCYAAVRAMEDGSIRAHAWLGAGCAAMWYCHPPVALLAAMAAAFCLAAQFAIQGPGWHAAWGGAVTAVVFAALVGPYLYALGEIPPTHFYFPLTNLVLPALALFLLLLSLLQAARRASIRWLALLPTVWLILRDFKPSLLPFAFFFSAGFAALVALERLRPRLAVRARPEPWLILLFLGSAAAAAAWFPGISLPARKTVQGVINPDNRTVLDELRTMVRGADTQPHAAWWFLLFAGLVLMWRASSRAARLLMAVTVVALVTIMPWPALKLFLWSNMTVELWDPFTDGSWLRFWPFALPVLLFAVFVLWNELTPGTRGRAAIRAAVWLFLPWMLWSHLGAVRSIFVHSAAETARLYRPENLVMQTYSWDLLRLPSYYSLGVVDPRLETRLWRQDGSRTLLVDPDLIAREMEKSGAERLVPQATQDATYRQWIYLAPKIELAPGEHKLLRFDFKGSAPSGWLIVRGQDIYREYILPSSGLERSFGSGPLNSHTLSLWNSGSDPETLELVLKRDGPAATAGIRAGEIPDIVVSRYDPSRAPVEVKSLSPLVLRVRAPEAGMLELFRSYYPGYRISLNGVPVRAIASRDGLIALPVPAGESEVAVRFRGTPTLRAMFWYGLAAWTWVALAAGLRLARAAGEGSRSGLRAVPIA